MKGLEPIGARLEQELGRLGPPGAISAVVASWPDAVGPAIAANAWPARIARDGTLHVSTGSSAWAFELTQLEETVRARLREHLGDACPARLRFATGRLPEPGSDHVEIQGRALPRPSRATLATAEEIAAPIADPDLRAAVARAAAASLTGAEPRPDDRSF
jgi:predicted nucleic acid-binding Zn ribbon protein